MTEKPRAIKDEVIDASKAQSARAARSAAEDPRAARLRASAERLMDAHDETLRDLAR